MMFIKIENGIGSSNGIYTESDLVNGKKSFQKDTENISWNGEKWQVVSSIDPYAVNTLYTSSENTQTPDLVSSWYEIDEEFPAKIGVFEIKFKDLKVKNAGSDIVNACYSVVEIKDAKPRYAKKGIIPVEKMVYIEWNDLEKWQFTGKGSISPIELSEVETSTIEPRIITKEISEPSEEVKPVTLLKIYYSAGEDVETPDLVENWKAGSDGVSPSPSISLGCSNFISVISKAVKRNRG